MPAALARLYELALRALDEQDRHVSDLRGRLAPILAAGGVGLTLLTPPAFAEAHPSGALELVAAIAGLVGAVVLVLASAYVLHPRALAFSIYARDALDAIRVRDAAVLTDDDRFHETTIGALTRRRRGNEPIVGRLRVACSIALFGLLVELGGLSLAAALAS